MVSIRFYNFMVSVTIRVNYGDAWVTGNARVSVSGISLRPLREDFILSLSSSF